MSEHFLGSYTGFEILANSGQDPLLLVDQGEEKTKEYNPPQRIEKDRTLVIPGYC